MLELVVEEFFVLRECKVPLHNDRDRTQTFFGIVHANRTSWIIYLKSKLLKEALPLLFVSTLTLILQ